MRLLCFHAKRFWWKSFSKTLEDVPTQEVEAEVSDAVVAFIQVEAADLEPERESSVVRQALKHIKWLANKREWKTIVLHSFAHLGGTNAAPDGASEILCQLGTRLADNGYDVHRTPFGYFNEWDLRVYGESLAKVWKQI